MTKMDSIVFYRSFYESLQVFQDASERAFMYDTILEYAFNGTEPSDLTPMQQAIFTLIKPQFDANQKKSEAGKRGGRPRKETTENEKPQVSEEKTIGFENENHRFLKTQTNKNNKSNKNSEYEYVSSNENKNFNLSHDIPTTTDIISELKTAYYMTDSEAADVSNAFIDFNSGRNWSSLETRSWQSLLKQFVGNDKRFTDDVLSERKAQADAKAEEERRQQEEAERYQDKSLYLETADDFINYVRNEKPFSPEEEVKKVALGYVFDDDELSELWNPQPVFVDESYGWTRCQFIRFDPNYGIQCFDSWMYKTFDTPLATKVRENFWDDAEPMGEIYEAIAHLLPDKTEPEPFIPKTAFDDLQ